MSAFKTMPCPIHAGKHPSHDHRWIVTSDAVVEMSPHVPGDWSLSSGSLICQMRDIGNQKEVATLFCAAPDMLAALEYIVAWKQDVAQWNAETARDLAKQAVAKAKGLV